jgi:DNA-binding response OmpR family regulator
MKILLVDDDQALVTVFDTNLRQAGYDVAFAYDAKSGLEKAKSEKPDLILLDQVLPDMQGNEVLKELKADPDTQTIPVAILSNFSQSELMQEAINSGALDYILKYQIEPQDLVTKVQGLLQEGQNTPAA